MPPAPAAPAPAAPAAPAPPPLVAPTRGLRWTWNAFPNATSAAKAAGGSVAAHVAPPLPPEMVVPLAANYTPLQPNADAGDDDGDDGTPPVAVVDAAAGGAEAVPTCRSCGVVWCPQAVVDAAGGRGYWACPACLQRNPLTHAPAPDEPGLTHTVTEYILSKPGSGGDGSGAHGADSTLRPAFFFVIDTSLSPEEFGALKTALLRSLEWLPPHALVGLVTFGHSVTLWEVGFEALNKCYSLRGTKSYSKVDLLAMLGVHAAAASGPAAAPAHPPSAAAGGAVEGRFLVPLEDCEFALSNIIQELAVEPFAVRPNERPLRATGAALEVAITLLELYGGGATVLSAAGPGGLAGPAATTAAPAGTCGKVILFTGGPCTRGPGTIASLDRGTLMRSAKDIAEGNAPLYEPAVRFFDGLQSRLTDARCCLDCFVESFDQVGILELRNCVDRTGGVFVCGDSFTHRMFAESFRRYFEVCGFRGGGSATEPAVAGFAAEVQVFTSRDTLICGCLGLASAAPQAPKAGGADGNSRCVSPLNVGIGGTNKWRVSALDRHATLTFVFDTDDAAATPAGSSSSPSPRFIQFQTTFWTIHGEKRLRVTSVAHPVAPTADASYFVKSEAFDQAAAASVVCRLAVHHMARYEAVGRAGGLASAKSWVDSLLVKFVKRFGSYRIGEPDSLRLAPSLSMFPFFLFNLRRSEFFLSINVSPDETTFKRHFLFRENTDNCLLMIQPTVFSYSFENPSGVPVPLDSSSIKPDAVLLMDAFFNVHVMKGETVHHWEQQKYHERDDMAHFKALLDTPVSHAEAIVARRHPYPRYSVTDQFGSDARHIVTRLNPAVSHNDAPSGPAGGQQHTVYTDHSSASRFMQTLKAAAVAPDKPA